MDTRIFLVLQNLADEILQSDICADREFANAITVGVGVRVVPEIIFEFAVLGMRFREAIAFHANRERRSFQIAEFCAEIITYYAIDHEGSVYFAWSGEDLAARQVAPFFRRDNA